MTELLQFDYYLFDLIHNVIKNIFFDSVMPLLRHKVTWAPLYLFIFLYAYLNMEFSKASLFIIGLLMTVLFTDIVSSQLIKKSVQRKRPCHTNQVIKDVNPLVKCGRGYSFPSSHASNHFGISFFVILSGFARRKNIKTLLITWASLISVAQIYVGVHFPLDIMAGCILGYLVARVVAIGYIAIYPLLNHPRISS